MAIDTAERRRSIAGIHLYPSGPGVTNNATQDQEWRQESGYCYSGIAIAVIAAAVELLLQSRAFDFAFEIRGLSFGLFTKDLDYTLENRILSYTLDDRPLTLTLEKLP